MSLYHLMKMRLGRGRCRICEHVVKYVSCSDICSCDGEMRASSRWRNSEHKKQINIFPFQSTGTTGSIPSASNHKSTINVRSAPEDTSAKESSAGETEECVSEIDGAGGTFYTPKSVRVAASEHFALDTARRRMGKTVVPPRLHALTAATSAAVRTVSSSSEPEDEDEVDVDEEDQACSSTHPCTTTTTASEGEEDGLVFVCVLCTCRIN